MARLSERAQVVIDDGLPPAVDVDDDVLAGQVVIQG
jgi:hypothetical protein